VAGFLFTCGYYLSMSKIKNDIIHSATELFLLNTYTEVSVREISTLAGVSNTYVHKLFGSKGGVLEACLDSADSDFMQLVRSENISTVLEGNLSHPLFRLLSLSAAQKEACRVVHEWLESKVAEVEENSLSWLVRTLSVGVQSDMRVYWGLNSLMFSNYLLYSNFLEVLGWSKDRVLDAQSMSHRHAVDLAIASAEAYSSGYAAALSEASKPEIGGK